MTRYCQPIVHQPRGAASQTETLVLQNLLLGINAHINYDLVLTLVEMHQSLCILK